MNDGILDLSGYVRVTNNTETVIKGRFDGQDYTFKVGAPVDINLLAAQHIFGFGLEDKTRAFHRFGWLENQTLDDAMARLAKITFEDVPAPAIDISSKRRAKISKPTPLVNAGADDGEEVSSSPSDATGTAGEL